MPKNAFLRVVERSCKKNFLLVEREVLSFRGKLVELRGGCDLRRKFQLVKLFFLCFDVFLVFCFYSAV